MNLQSGGFLVTVSNLDASVDFYSKAMELQVLATDGTAVMLGPANSSSGRQWLLALRRAGGDIHPSGSMIGIRALFFRVDYQELDALEERLRSLGGFHERHHGEFYEMVSAYSPDRNALGFWAASPDSPADGPTFVPPSIYSLDA
jgi:catechol 2,3-dioxygenase-like lactoylglutathione lyase family enzyme